MKKRFISVVMVLALFCLSFNGVNAATVNLEPEIDEGCKFYRYDADTNKVTQFTQAELQNRNDPLGQVSTLSEASDVLSTEEYVPEHLSIEMPSQVEPRLLLGSWTEINPATTR